MLSSVLNYRRGGGGGWSHCIIWKFLPPVAFNNAPPPDYKTCKEHLPTHFIFTPSLHDSQPSFNTQTQNLRRFYKTGNLQVGKSLLMLYTYC